MDREPAFEAPALARVGLPPDLFAVIIIQNCIDGNKIGHLERLWAATAYQKKGQINRTNGQHNGNV